MAAPDSAHTGLSAEELQDERYIAAMCRNVRLQNDELHKKRERLRKEIQEIQERSYLLEGRYWLHYHARLADLSTANSNGSTRKWISTFGENEKQLADALAKRQDKLREEARLKQEELATVDSEFWGAWRKHVDFMRGLTPLPPSSGSTPATTVPAAPPQPADNQASSPLSSTHSQGETAKDQSTMHSPNGQKPSESGKPIATSKPLPAGSFTYAMAVHPQGVGYHISGPPQGLATSAMQSSQSASASPGPATPVYSLLPPISITAPRISAPVSKPQRVLRSSAAEEPGDFAVFESQGESSQESADDLHPTKPHKAAAAASQPIKTSATVGPAKLSPLALPKLITPQNQDDGFVGVTDPVVGEIYKGFYKDANYQGWWYCTPLPWDAWEREIGIRYSFQQADLFKDLPECYTTDRVRAKAKGRKMKSIITGWKKGFEVGGPRARERVFPVLFFDDMPGEPGNFTFPDSPEKIFTFSKRALRALPAEWVSAADLRLPGADVGRPVRGRDTAEQFRERVRARRALQAKKKLGTPKRTSIGSSSAVEASSPVGDTSREDTEMADAESLSGATAVDEMSVQPDDREGPKTPPTAKTSSSGSDKGWRAVVLGQES